jgi:hypothetical protein
MPPTFFMLTTMLMSLLLLPLLLPHPTHPTSRLFAK